MLEVKTITRLGESVVVSQDVGSNAGGFVVSVSVEEQAFKSIDMTFDELKKFAHELFGAVAIWDTIRKIEFSEMKTPPGDSVS